MKTTQFLLTINNEYRRLTVQFIWDKQGPKYVTGTPMVRVN